MIPETDAYWPYVKHLLHFSGVPGSAKVVDEKHSIWTTRGAASSDAKPIFGATSLLCSAYNNTPFVSLTAVWGSLDACIEMFVSPAPTNVAATPMVWSLAAATSSGLWIQVNGTGAGKVQVFLGAFSTTVPLLESVSNIPVDTWTHIAVTRTGANTWKLWVGGALEATAINATALSTSSSCYIGSGATSTTYFSGHISNYRYTLGAGRYFADFTVPSAPFPHSGVIDPYYANVVLHCHFNAEDGVIGATDQKGHVIAAFGTPLPITTLLSAKFGGSSLNQTGQAVGLGCVTTSADFSPGTQDFCFEGFAKPNPGGSQVFQPLFQLMAADGITTALSVEFYPYNNQVIAVVNGVTQFPMVASGAGGWGYFCLFRLGAIVYFWCPAVGLRSVNIGADTAINSNGVLYLGGGVAPKWGMFGQIDEFRFTIGGARYSGTPPTPTDPFPDYGPRKMTGTVRDPSGNPISRVVRSYRSSDGVLVDSGVSDSTTGAFELRAHDVSEHFVVVHDPVKNALVFDHIDPVI